jgi:hypothetical protein
MPTAYDIGPTPVVTGTAVLSGTLDRVVLFEAAPLVTGTAVLSAVFDLETALNHLITASAVLSGHFHLAIKLTSTIHSNSEIDGTLIRLSQPAEGAEANYDATGVRTSIPLLVYALNVVTLADTASVPFGGSFIMSASYTGESEDGMFDSGAAPNAIGTRIKPTVGPAFLVFRQPVEEEVVWIIPLDQLYRFHFVRSVITP